MNTSAASLNDADATSLFAQRLAVAQEESQTYPALPDLLIFGAEGKVWEAAVYSEVDGSQALMALQSEEPDLSSLDRPGHVRVFTENLSLDAENLTDYWYQRGALNVVRLLADRENWTVDRLHIGSDRDWPQEISDRRVRQSLDRLCQSLVEVAKNDASALNQFVKGYTIELLSVLGMLSTGRAVALLAWINSANEDAGAYLMTTARVSATTAALMPEKVSLMESQYSRLLLQRIQSLQRRALLSVVFSSERTIMLMQELSFVHSAFMRGDAASEAIEDASEHGVLA